MRRSILLSLGVVCLLTLALTAGSFSYFSAKVDIKGNTMIAGTLYLGQEGSPGTLGILAPGEDIARLMPGEDLGYRVTVKNLGTAEAYVNGISTLVEETPDKFLANALRVKAVLNGSTLFEGSLLALDGKQPVPAEAEVRLAPGETADLDVNIRLDRRTGNWYKGKKLGDVSLSLWATQLPRSQQPLDTRVRLAAGDLQGFLNAARPGDVVLVPPGAWPRLRMSVEGVTVKARDVIYETSVAGLDLLAPGVSVAGFYVTAVDGKEGITVAPGASAGSRISDNIVVRRDDCAIRLLPDANATDGQPAVVERNDVRRPAGSQDEEATDRGAIRAAVPAKVQFNLGADLDPATEAL